MPLPREIVRESAIASMLSTAISLKDGRTALCQSPTVEQRYVYRGSYCNIELHAVVASILEATKIMGSMTMGSTSDRL